MTSPEKLQEKLTFILDNLETLMPAVQAPREGAPRDAYIDLRREVRLWTIAKSSDAKDVFFSY